jgi:hypothetical protein
MAGAVAVTGYRIESVASRGDLAEEVFTSRGLFKEVYAPLFNNVKEIGGITCMKNKLALGEVAPNRQSGKLLQPLLFQPAKPSYLPKKIYLLVDIVVLVSF